MVNPFVKKNHQVKINISIVINFPLLLKHCYSQGIVRARIPNSNAYFLGLVRYHKWVRGQMVSYDVIGSCREYELKMG